MCQIKKKNLVLYFFFYCWGTFCLCVSDDIISLPSNYHTSVISNIAWKISFHLMFHSSLSDCVTRWCLKVSTEKDIWQWQQLVQQTSVQLRCTAIFSAKHLLLLLIKILSMSKWSCWLSKEVVIFFFFPFFLNMFKHAFAFLLLQLNRIEVHFNLSGVTYTFCSHNAFNILSEWY